MATEAYDAALTLITQRNIGSNMTTLAEAVSRKTVTYSAIENSLGTDRAKAVVSAELKRLRPKYQPKWDQNLAQIYAERFTADELHSLSTLGKASPSVPKLASMQNEIGRAMQARSSDLLKRYVSEALSAALAQIPPKP
ncbi:hypothetical protein DN412_29570 [Cupriavidus lacunae]|uniref:Uncharacterized protein n=2 Tax=Cupriavidus lacunae TaxID=2666307 RepID=A0A370NMK5_9BURK|nr:hypothetical protein DN412_29570 [Cupriavidus lacunae]